MAVMLMYAVQQLNPQAVVQLPQTCRSGSNNNNLNNKQPQNQRPLLFEMNQMQTLKLFCLLEAAPK
jgi:hypothetical protein